MCIFKNCHKKTLTKSIVRVYFIYLIQLFANSYFHILDSCFINNIKSINTVC